MKNLKTILSFFFLAIVTIVHAQSVDTLKIESNIFHQARKVKVVLPAGYDEYPNTQERYLVAYLFDAQSEDFFNFYKTTVNYLSKLGYLQPLILVGIESNNRQFEFTPKAQTAAGLKSFYKSGGADSLALSLKNEIMPVITNKYRCANYNIGIGHSLGATFVTYALLKFPELFNAGIAISPNFHYDQEQIVHKFDSLANSKILNHKFLYMAHGSGDLFEDDFKTAAEKVHNLLIEKNISGLRWEFKNLDNEDHGTTAMEGIFKGLIALNKQLALSNILVDKMYKDKSKPFIQGIKSYYLSSSAWAGLKLPNVQVINDMGYYLFYNQRSAEAIQVFEWGLTLYPENINLHDSMGEMQQKAGNNKAALEYYTKALQMVKKLDGKIESKAYNDQVTYFEGRIKDVRKLN